MTHITRLSDIMKCQALSRSHKIELTIHQYRNRLLSARINLSPLVVEKGGGEVLTDSMYTTC